MAATYRYRDLHRQPTDGEIWSPGPLHKTLWVLGPDGPVVVDADTRTQVRYEWPHWDTDHVGIGGWVFTHHAPRSNTGRLRSETLRYGRAPITAKLWQALTAGAFEVGPQPIPGTDLIPSWELPLDLPRLAA